MDEWKISVKMNESGCKRRTDENFMTNYENMVHSPVEWGEKTKCVW